jgi:hypothetical protein
MKTTNVILVGVVGVGAIGAYMYMKNKKAENALLSGSMPATTPTGTPSSGTPPLATTPLIPTPNLTEPVKINDSNLDAFNLQATLGKLKDLENELKAEPKKVSFMSGDKKGYDTWLNWYINIGKPSVYEFRRKPFIDRLASLGYKFDNGLLIKI